LPEDKPQPTKKKEEEKEEEKEEDEIKLQPKEEEVELLDLDVEEECEFDDVPLSELNLLQLKEEEEDKTPYLAAVIIRNKRPLWGLKPSVLYSRPPHCCCNTIFCHHSISIMPFTIRSVLLFKKLSGNAITPSKGSKLASGFDLCSAYYIVIPGQGKALIKTDIQVELPEDCYGRVAPRSGLSWKNHIDVGAGVIDRDYRGNVGVVLFNHAKTDFEVKNGDRVAQLICEKIVYPDIEEVEVVSVYLLFLLSPIFLNSNKTYCTDGVELPEDKPQPNKEEERKEEEEEEYEIKLQPKEEEEDKEEVELLDLDVVKEEEECEFDDVPLSEAETLDNHRKNISPSPLKGATTEKTFKTLSDKEQP
ncbi:Deoxyuridine 5'-triphosphate nucleotidohydrolase-like 3, partial [Homarus americanus]